MRRLGDRRTRLVALARRAFLALGLAAALASLILFAASVAQGMGLVDVHTGAWVLAGVAVGSLIVYMIGVGVGERLQPSPHPDPVVVTPHD